MSAVALVAVAVALVVLYRHNAVRDLVEVAESHNVALARSIANSIWPRFSSYVMAASVLDRDALRARPETRELREALRTLTADLPVLKVKVYNLNGLTVFSSQESQIGDDKSNNLGFFAAARQGKPASKLAHKHRFSAFDGVVFERDFVESYVSIGRTDGPIEGVFELYSDVTPFVGRIERTGNVLLLGLLLIFGLLYAVLFVIVRHADRILKRQYIELERSEKNINAKNAALAREVTERKAAEEQLRNFYRAIEQSPASVMIGDTEGRIEYVNPKFTQVTGRSPKEVIGQKARIMKPGYPTAEEHERFWQTITSGRTWRGEFHNRKKNGEFYWEAVAISPVRNPDGFITHFVAVKEDITERKQAQAQLIQATKLATLGEMATGMAHELNQPLNVIRMAAESTAERLEEGRQTDADFLIGKLQRISAQTERMAAIIDHMRIFGRTADDEPELLDPRNAIEGVIGLMGQQLRLRDIVVNIEQPGHCQKILGHRVLIEQVLLNLLSNARDAIEAAAQAPNDGDGTAPQEIILKVEDDVERRMVRIIVRDTGGGIPEDVIDRIFEPFFTTKEVGKGTGLGLSVSYGIIKEMGGTIEAANVDGGAQITITLPAAASEPEAARRAQVAVT